MARKRITRESVEREQPELRRLLATHMHEDWPIDYDSPEASLDEAFRLAPHDMIAASRQQLSALLKAAEDGADLRRILNDCLGVNLRFQKPRDPAAFAQLVERKLGAALQTSKER